MNTCKNCGEQLSFKMVNNRKRWIYGTIAFLVFISGFMLMVWFKVFGLIMAILLDWYIWNWFTQKVDYVGLCKKCG